MASSAPLQHDETRFPLCLCDPTYDFDSIFKTWDLHFNIVDALLSRVADKYNQEPVSVDIAACDILLI